jgi:hypothetical protein
VELIVNTETKDIFNYLAMASDCGVGGTSTGTITHLVINVENDELYFTIDRIIYRQKQILTSFCGTIH